MATHQTSRSDDWLGAVAGVSQKTKTSCVTTYAESFSSGVAHTCVGRVTVNAMDDDWRVVGSLTVEANVCKQNTTWFQ